MIKLDIVGPAGSKLAAVVRMMEEDVELQTLWYCANRNARRAAVNDHGPVHVRLVMNYAYEMLRLLIEAGVKPSSMADHALTEDDAAVIVVTAVAFHDTGMSVHRDWHEQYSVPLAMAKLRLMLQDLYSEPERTIIISEALHALVSHSLPVRCLTLEAGIVKVADALDMTKGRSRRAIENGKIDIHSISAAAIDRVRVCAGTERPIRVEVEVSNPAAVFQLKEVFGGKLAQSGLAPYVEIPTLDRLLETLSQDGQVLHAHQASETLHADQAGETLHASSRQDQPLQEAGIEMRLRPPAS